VPYLKLIAAADRRPIEVRAATALLGRDPAAAIVVAGEGAGVVSARHAELRHAGDRWVIHDLGSRNGTYVNGRRLAAETPLAVNDEIQLGETGPRFTVGAITEGLPATQVEIKQFDLAAAGAQQPPSPPAPPPVPPSPAAPPPHPPEVRPYAVTLLAGDSGRRFEARGTRIRIGRGKECEVRPVDPSDSTVSRVHAELTAGPSGALALRDAGSKNGTRLNGEPVTRPTPVRLGDRIQLGPDGPVLIVEGMGTSPGLPAAQRKDAAGALGQATVMGMIGAALAQAREAPTRRRRTTTFVKAMAEQVGKDSRRKIRWLTGALVVLVLLLAGAGFAAYRLFQGLSAEVAETERAMRSVEDSARAESERLRRELAEARAASAPASQVESLRARLESAQVYAAELRMALDRAQADLRTQLQTVEQRRQESQAEVQRLREQLAAAERRTPSAAVLDSLRRAVQAAEAQTSHLTAQVRAVRSTDFASIAQQSQTAVGLITVRLGGSYFDGTGFVVSPDGYMLTNWHVVADSEHAGPDTVWVTMADESKARYADLVATSRERDIAVLKIRGYQGAHLTAIDWSGTKARQGEPAALIGFPAGSGFARDRSAVVRTSMTAGILSRVTADLIQFDGMTIGGSSGSPVFNANGEVISVHRAGLRQGPGFALSVPVRYAIPLLPQVLRERLGLPGSP
jgi:pSer/pThr/pTyr-binding forkhead associated (FHA) protein/S1-C subfamily serine protease